MTETTQQFIARKQDHIRLALDPNNQTLGQSDIDAIELIHEAMPDLNFADLCIQSKRFGSTIPYPFFISSMTAGHVDGVKINAVLAKACQEHGWAMGVGSQRRQLTDIAADSEWQSVLKLAPNVDFYGNIGIAQIINAPIDSIKRLLDSLNAKALFVHLNPLQECIQTEGTLDFKGGFTALENLSKHLNVPIIVKETGCGFSAATLQHLNNLDLTAVDLSGKGGTHWGRIEGGRASEDKHALAATTFANWGISTVQSMLNALEINPIFEIWASGGIRTGLEAAKYLSMGASSIGIAKPMLEAALHGVDAVIKAMQQFEFELKIAMFCTGCGNIDALRGNKVWKLKK